VEAGEYAADALRRELTEELGIAVHVGRLREWSRRGSLMMGRVDEVGLYFTVDVGEVATDALGRSSQEDTLEVAWFNLRDLDRVVVRPPCLVEVLTTATGFPVHLVERGPDVAS
jgi:8-oxo-dGTP pyrophosphatase MutT (NUDIX family)